jgi:hypothetical protein
VCHRRRCETNIQADAEERVSSVCGMDSSHSEKWQPFANAILIEHLRYNQLQERPCNMD